MFRALVVGALTALIVGACSDDPTFQFPVPEEPLESDLFDLATGPVGEPSALDVVSGRGNGLPRPVRVEQSEQWDIAFGMSDQGAEWLPRGVFEGLPISSGIVQVPGTFESVTNVPGNSEEYIDDEPVSIEVGAVYAVRSRADPVLSLPCHIFGKIGVLSVAGNPVRVQFEILWNPNCGGTNVSSSGS
ncbi:MAG: hypothetical protein V3U63_09445 [Gemmatimonadota bacterium]